MRKPGASSIWARVGGSMIEAARGKLIVADAVVIQFDLTDRPLRVE